MKKCSCCGVEKDFCDYQIRAASKDGLTSSCKSCLKARDAIRYIKEKPYRTLNHKAYLKTADGKAAHARAVQTWREKNTLRRAANVILNNAVKSGKVLKQPCFVCGEIAEAHHSDYSRPLDVVWLCPYHHKQAHAAINNVKTDN